jgi:hypothetical protein
MVDFFWGSIVKYRLMLHQFTVLVHEFSREKTGLLQPGYENSIARPQLQVQKFLILDPP